MTSDNSLDWTAFCYLAGELNAEDLFAFESLLETDQAAREALARAVELTQVVAAAEAQHSSDCPVVVTARSPSPWSTRVSWMAVGSLASLAAGLLIAIALGQLDWPIGSGSRANQIELAAAWTQTGDELLQLADVGLAPRGSASGGDLDDEPSISLVANIDDPMGETPSWLTAAVSNQLGETPEQTLGGTESL